MIAQSSAEPGTSQFAVYRETRHFGSLNGLRFLCILAVLWHHAPIWALYDSSALLASRGFLGVDFFFVLSGYLITTLLQREEAGTGRIYLRGFYWRRCLRIVPVYFLVVSCAAFYYIVVKGQLEYLELLPYYYLFLSNFLTSDIPLLAPTWSLSVEEQYYLVWPLLLVLVPRNFIKPLLIVLITLNFLAVTDALRPLGIRAVEADPLVFKMFNATYAPILIGSGLAILLHKKASFDRLYSLAGQPASAPVAFLVLLILLVILPGDLIGWPNMSLHLTMAFCLATLVVREDNAMHRVLSIRPIVRIGEISYGIYLYHLIGLHIANVGLPKVGIDNGWVVFVVYSLISIAIAELSFRYYEGPFLRLRHRVPGSVGPHRSRSIR